MPEIRKIESGKLLCLDGDDTRKLGELFSQLEAFAKARQLPLKGGRLAMFYDDPATLNRQQTRFAAGLELAGEATGDGDILVVIQSSMTVASASHQGTWNSLTETYRGLLQWIQEQGYRITGPAREFYLNGPWPDSAESQVEVQIPVVKD
jgi:effector-binding domain-containing protein